MQDTPIQSSHSHDFSGGASRKDNGDFTTDKRVLVLIAMALVVGTGGAFAAWVLINLIALVSNAVWLFKISTEPLSFAMVTRSPWMVAAPILGGLVIGLMARYGSEKIRGHGIPEAIEAILIGGSRMSPKVAVLKPLSSAISIGSGGPFGAEGPIIMTGGAIGSLFAQFFHMSAAERKTLLVAGAAAGMTAVFGTPIAAVMLAVELLLFEWKPRSFIPVAVAACVSVVWRPVLLGSGALFPAHFDMSLSWWSIVLAAGLGIVSGLQSGLLTTLLYKIEDAFEKLPIHWMWWPALGGLVVGLGGLIEPRALGVGYDIVADLLHSHITIAAVLAILLVKAGIWLVALSSGTSGGVLAPLLILGGTLGWLVGLILPGDPGFWAMLGMAAMMGGTMRAPLTGTFFAVELTGDMSALVPLLAATVAAYAVTVLLLKRSILTEKIARRGQHITREYGIDPFELTRARDIMISKVDTLPASMRLSEALTQMTEQPDAHRFYPVVGDNDRLVGMISRADALRWQGKPELMDQSLYDAISDTSLPVAHAEDTVGRVADIMIQADTGRVPVVEPQTGRLVGLIARKDLLRLRSATNRAELERGAYLRSKG
ncbi:MULTISPECIES: chloride channel protein [Rhizobium]|uniref:Chloride channel protein n=1 Tax=Rhizobium tropici TaxID=398 RepID=A0A6P1C8G2_RHITR|nr:MULTISPECIES: chloride channel protein [Rhizobium]AGB72329.1 ClC-type chloride channel [Rhizobium tropici CIAT 899]MBB4243142.1 H+/Cl- antiporter ClcA/predicted transcriptional regulator [Rhizobium tropici]MBB5594785.1 H+/Cl- antiporter ClcA/predicted transcriptional regulator [Rhizobium tropici]MBB6493468.1 H+/Cl- antiporter ClcA/predicted transcriptional regulator [Rhizobium tropici]NEV11853.1 chloride channel protein [Rhizobium tropici]